MNISLPHETVDQGLGGVSLRMIHRKVAPDPTNWKERVLLDEPSDLLLVSWQWTPKGRKRKRNLSNWRGGLLIHILFMYLSQSNFFMGVRVPSMFRKQNRTNKGSHCLFSLFPEGRKRPFFFQPNLSF